MIGETKNLIKAFLVFFLALFFLFLVKVLDIAYPVSIVSTTKTNELSVVGEARIKVVPDTAYVRVGRVYKKESVKEVQEGLNKANSVFLGQLEKLGIKKNAVRTTDYSVYPEYDYTQGQKIIGYIGNLRLEVKVKDFNLVPKILTLAEDSEMNQIEGVNFVVDDWQKYRQQAREKAIENAKNQAEKIAKSLGIKLGKVTNFTESLSSSPIFPDRPVSFGAGGGEMMKFEPGEETIVSQVTVYFEKK